MSANRESYEGLIVPRKKSQITPDELEAIFYLSLLPGGYGGGCQACGQPDEGYMLRDKLWYSVAREDEILCLACVQGRLGRPLTRRDFIDYPINILWRAIAKFGLG